MLVGILFLSITGIVQVLPLSSSILVSDAQKSPLSSSPLSCDAGEDSLVYAGPYRNENPLTMPLDPEAHELLKIPDVRNRGASGYGITIAVIDNGVYPHPYLTHPTIDGQSIAKNTVVFTAKYTGYSWEVTSQEYGTGWHQISGVNTRHGTAVTGVIRQIAPIVRYIFLLVANPVGVQNINEDAIGNAESLAEIFDWLTIGARYYGIDAVCMSMGIPYDFPLPSPTKTHLYTAVNSFTYFNPRIPLIVAAGNEGYEGDQTNAADTLRYPASHTASNVWAIGATYDSDLTDTISPYLEDYKYGMRIAQEHRWNHDWWGSSYGNQLDFMAPGWHIKTPSGSNEYAYFARTSAAAPHMAGAYALLLEAYRYYQSRGLRVRHPFDVLDGEKAPSNFWSPSGMFYPLDITAGWDKYYGYGIIDLYKVLCYMNYGRPCLRIIQPFHAYVR